MATYVPDLTNQTWIDQGGLFYYCFQNPKSQYCKDVPGYYQYTIDLAPNAVFLAIFTSSLIGFVITWIITRRGTAFNVALILGLICEVIGYAGRILSWQNRWSENGFLVQICCLTIGPAFMAAGIYLCLRRIVSAFGPENSRLPPEYYTRIVSWHPPAMIDADIILLSVHPLRCCVSCASSPGGCHGFNRFSPAQKYRHRIKHYDRWSRLSSHNNPQLHHMFS